MAFCTKCGTELPNDARFCPNCGTPTADNKGDNIQRKIEYEGTIHKCPNCGEIVKAFTLNCPSCGYEFRDSRTTNSVKELASQLEELEKRKGKKKLRDMFLGAYGHFTNEDDQRINLIRNFPIPSTKEDVVEFAILASSNIDIKSYGLSGVNNKILREISDAWMAKFEQAHQKAKLLFGDSTDFHRIDTLYSEKKKQIKHEKQKLTLSFVLMAVGGILLLMSPALFGLFLVYCTP